MITARNIVLISLILDDLNGANNQLIWNIFYHFRIDEGSLALLQTQTAKLLALSTSLRTWQQSQYGQMIRICDRVSLEQIRGMWGFYGEKRQGDVLRRFNKELDNGRRISLEFRKFFAGDRMNVVPEIRASAPVCLEATHDLGDLYRTFWAFGTTETDETVRSYAIHSNPMFGPNNGNMFLHYGTNPVLGFHIASCYVPIDQITPQSGSSFKRPELHEIVNAAKAEFGTWAKSFRAHFGADLITLRFFVGDEMAFSYALQQMHTTGPVKPSHWYRDRFHFHPLVLDDEHYADTSAPLLFDIVDTSYLIDHFGALNLLTATAPLLRHESSATLYSEKLVRTKDTQMSLLETFLCGDMATVTSLLGLVPVELATNTSSSSTGTETLFQEVIRPPYTTDQVIMRIAWKRPLNPGNAVMKTLGPIHFHSDGLAYVLHHVFLKLFPNEDALRLFVTRGSPQMPSLPTYNRASFVAFLCLVKTRTSTDWNTTMATLLDLIDHDTRLPFAHTYRQELQLWMHMQGLYSVNTFRSTPNPLNHHPQTGTLKDWQNIPPMVSVTLRIPRSTLGPFIAKTMEIGFAPPLHGVLHSSAQAADQWQHMFAATQIGFGSVKSKGSRYSDSFKIEIDEDQFGWTGKSSMFLSFYVPSWILLEEPCTATVSLAMAPSPTAVTMFEGSFGVNLNIFTAEQHDGEHVYMTKVQPHQSGVISICGFDPDEVSNQLDPEGNSETTVTATVDETTGQISSFTNRVQIISEESKALLRDGCAIKRSVRSPFNYVLSLQDGPSFIANFPAPILDSTVRVKIARKSSYLEVIADVAKPGHWAALRSFMYPVVVDDGSPVLWNMPRLDLPLLPVIDLANASYGDLRWLRTHLPTMLSEKEIALNLNTSFSGSPSARDRVEFKNALLHIFASFSGIAGRKARAYGIYCAEAKGMQMVIFLSKLLFDASNRTVVLDAAVIPISTEIMPEVIPALNTMSGSGYAVKWLRTSEDVVRLWKEAVPAWTERCRSWSHKADCEYATTERIPLSVKLGERVLCSCGEGAIPTDFMPQLPVWNDLAKHAVRMAISPPFASVLVGKPIDSSTLPDFET